MSHQGVTQGSRLTHVKNTYKSQLYQTAKLQNIPHILEKISDNSFKQTVSPVPPYEEMGRNQNLASQSQDENSQQAKADGKKADTLRSPITCR